MPRRLSSFVTIALAISATPLYGANVKVTDSKGNAVEVRNVEIDYTHYPSIGLYTPDHESEGVRAYQGDGIVTIKWEQIEQLVIKRVKPEISPSRLVGDVALKNKTVASVNLVYSEKGLQGTTDLGVFKILLADISTITVLPRAKR
ncbi:MAG TPA: hypothetical protein VKV15_10750 [Bryobacteraceae bacterium]|nr:hypothetical protein [Bryobacteraceae bacterium]